MTSKREQKKWDDIHKLVDGVIYKQCSICNEWFVEEEENFYKASATSSNYKPYCKTCMKKKSADWLYSHYDKKKEYNRKQYLRTEIKEYLSCLSKQRRASGKYAEWQRKNKDKTKIYREKRHNKKHKITKNEWIKCKEYFNNSCAYCGLPLEKHLHIYRGETKQHDFQKEHVIYNGRNDLKNCIPSCKKCNTSKQSLTINQWYNKENPNYTYERYYNIYLWIRYAYKEFIKEKLKI